MSLRFGQNAGRHPNGRGITAGKPHAGLAQPRLLRCQVLWIGCRPANRAKHKKLSAGGGGFGDGIFNHWTQT